MDVLRDEDLVGPSDLSEVEVRHRQADIGAEAEVSFHRPPLRQHRLRRFTFYKLVANQSDHIHARGGGVVHQRLPHLGGAGGRADGPAGLEQLAGLHEGPLGLLEQAGVLDSGGQLIRHRPQRGDVLFCEGGGFAGLDGHRADHPAAADQREGHLGAGLRQEWVVEADGLRAHVQGDAGLAVGGAPSDHRLTAHLQPVAHLQHLLARLSGAGAQHRPTPRLIQQEDTNVVEAEPLTDQLHRLGEEFLQAEDGGSRAGDLGGGRQLSGPAGGLLQQAAVLQRYRHLVGDGADAADVLFGEADHRLLADERQEPQRPPEDAQPGADHPAHPHIAGGLPHGVGDVGLRVIHIGVDQYEVRLVHQPPGGVSVLEGEGDRWRHTHPVLPGADHRVDVAVGGDALGIGKGGDGNGAGVEAQRTGELGGPSHDLLDRGRLADDAGRPVEGLGLEEGSLRLFQPSDGLDGDSGLTGEAHQPPHLLLRELERLTVDAVDVADPLATHHQGHEDHAAGLELLEEERAHPLPQAWVGLHIRDERRPVRPEDGGRGGEVAHRIPGGELAGGRRDPAGLDLDPFRHLLRCPRPVEQVDGEVAVGLAEDGMPTEGGEDVRIGLGCVQFGDGFVQLLRLRQSGLGFLKEVGVLNRDGGLAGDGGQKLPVVFVVGAGGGVVLDGDHSQHPIAEDQRHPQPGEGRPPDHIDPQLRQPFGQVIRDEHRLPAAHHVLGEAVPQGTGAPLHRLAVLDGQGERDGPGFWVVEGDVEVGGIQQAGGTPIGLDQHLLQVEAGGEGLSQLVQHGQLLGVEAGLLEEAGVLQRHRYLVGQGDGQVQLALGKVSLFVPDLQLDDADRLAFGRQRDDDQRRYIVLPHIGQLRRVGLRIADVHHDGLEALHHAGGGRVVRQPERLLRLLADDLPFLGVEIRDDLQEAGVRVEEGDGGLRDPHHLHEQAGDDLGDLLGLEGGAR